MTVFSSCPDRSNAKGVFVEVFETRLTAVAAADVTPGPLTYQWSVSSFTGANNVSQLATTSGNGAILTVPAGRLPAASQFTFTCQVSPTYATFPWKGAPYFDKAHKSCPRVQDC